MSVTPVRKVLPVPAGDSSLRSDLVRRNTGSDARTRANGSRGRVLDRHLSCRRWAAAGNCVRLQGFMHEGAPPPATDARLPLLRRTRVRPSGSGRSRSVAQTFGRAAALEHLKPRVLSEDPFVLVFDDLTRRAAEVASLAEDVGFEPSGSSCGYRAGGCNSASMSCLPVQGSDCWSLAAT